MMAQAERSKNELSCILTELVYSAFDTAVRSQLIINRLAKNFLFENLETSELDELNDIAQTVPTEDVNWTQRKLISHLKKIQGRQNCERDSPRNHKKNDSYESEEDDSISKLPKYYKSNKQSNQRSRRRSSISECSKRASSVSDRSRRASSVIELSKRASASSVSGLKRSSSVLNVRSRKSSNSLNGNDAQPKKPGRPKRKTQEPETEDTEPIRKKQRQAVAEEASLSNRSNCLCQDSVLEADPPKLRILTVPLQDVLKDPNAMKYINLQKLPQNLKQLLQKKQLQLKEKTPPEEMEDDDVHEIVDLVDASSEEEEQEEAANSDEKEKSEWDEMKIGAEQSNDNVSDTDSEGEKNQDRRGPRTPPGNGPDSEASEDEGSSPILF